MEKGVPHEEILEKYVPKQDVEKKYEDLREYYEQYKLEIENVMHKIFEEKSEKLTSLNKTSLDSVLNPLKEKIEEFKNKVEQTHNEDIKETVSLKTEIGNLIKLNKDLSEDANNLANALKGDNKVMGNWGEFQLEVILKKAGLVENINYKKQASLTDRDGADKKPDYIIMLPDDKDVIIDSKVSLVGYEKYYNEQDSDKKRIFLKEHLKSIQDHIKNLSSKNYQSLYGINPPDYVLLFMPIEPALGIAINEEPKLFETALENNIVIVSVSTLLATLRTIAYIWKQENQRKNVMEIARQAGAMYDKFVDFVADLDKVGEKIDDANDSYLSAMNKLKDSKKKGDTLIGRAEKIKELGANTSKFLVHD
ncbi:DNA recombination protein RmuC [Elusimicrobiota bacterium]